ncbi:MAG TPA: hotdog fold thioesterase [Pyrinomonadaceae bacterium]|nr:hotdog fold thioesterase [Pyrinomonadaceae bacterium]
MDKRELLEKTLDSELLRFLGVRAESVEAERVVLSMQVTPRVHQYIGIMNGGVSLVLAETAASIGAVMRSDLSRVAPVGIEINANHLRAVAKGKVTVEANSVYHGKTISVWQIEIKDERQRLVCVSRCTIALRKGGADLIDKTK